MGSGMLPLNYYDFLISYVYMICCFCSSPSGSQLSFFVDHGASRAVVLQVWLMEQHYQHHLETHEKCKYYMYQLYFSKRNINEMQILRPHLGPTESEILGMEPTSLV